MNERIRALAIEAGAGEWGDSVIPAMMDIEKFTWLIVQQCVDIAYAEGDNVAYLANYFGAER
jgi:hypothetical protein